MNVPFRAYFCQQKFPEETWPKNYQGYPVKNRPVPEY
jgi:hypothetical protein